MRITEGQKTAFLKDLDALFAKHNLVLVPEDQESAFVVKEWNPVDVEWVLGANVSSEDGES